MNYLNIKNLLWKCLKKLSNLNLSLFVLFLIIIVCIMGSILEQDQDISYYKLNYVKFSFIILFLGLDHIFRTWWFILLLCTLVASLISCTLSTQLPSLKNSRRWKFIYSHTPNNFNIYDMNTHDIFQYSSTNIIYALISSSFFVFCRNGSIYAYKGLYGRIAPIFVHFSIITVLLGSVYGLFYSFVVQEVVPTGETFHLKNLVYSGLYSSLPSNLYTHIDEFYIKYYNNGSIKQFFSRLSFYLNSKQIYYSKLIHVNQPLHFHNLTFYQTNWEVNGLRLSINRVYFFQQKFFKRNNSGQAFWLSPLYTDQNQKILLVLTNLNNKILICTDNGSILAEIAFGQKFYVNSVPYFIENTIASTGLQIKYDPSIILVYLGFLVMIITTFLSYISYSQIWIHLSVSSLNFLGSTNRATLFFEQDVILVNNIYIAYCKSYLYRSLKNLFILR